SDLFPPKPFLLGKKNLPLFGYLPRWPPSFPASVSSGHILDLRDPSCPDLFGFQGVCRGCSVGYMQPDPAKCFLFPPLPIRTIPCWLVLLFQNYLVMTFSV